MVSFVLAAVVLGGAAAAAWVGPLGDFAAWTAFVLTIPFMSTLVPYLLGGVVPTGSGTAMQPSSTAPVQPSRDAAHATSGSRALLS